MRRFITCHVFGLRALRNARTDPSGVYCHVYADGSDCPFKRKRNEIGGEQRLSCFLPSNEQTD